MKKQTDVEALRTEINTLNKKRELLTLDSLSWKRNKNKADKLLQQIIELKAE